jgi:Fur family ferric uptake transcriptional regulator
MNSSSETILKNADLRITSQRISLLEFISSKPYAISNQEIEENIEDIDRITLYRTLKTFEEKGIIHRIVDNHGASKYSICQDACSKDHNHRHDHIHFHCHQCDNTFCLNIMNLPSVHLPSGFTKHSTEIMVCGICDSCNP